MNVRFHFHELSHLRHSSDPLIFTGILQPSTASIYKEKYSRIISEELQVIHYVFTTWKFDLPTEVSPFISAIFYSLFVAIAMRRKRLTNFSVQASSQRRLPSLYRLVKKKNDVEPSLPRDRDRNLHSFVRSKEITVYICFIAQIFFQ